MGLIHRAARAAILWSLLSGAVATPAWADDQTESTVRQRHGYLLGVSPTWPWISGADATMPLPALRLGVQVARRTSVELTAGAIPIGDGASMWIADLGGRWFATTGTLAPYVMVRAGDYADRGGDGGDRSYPFAALGGGIDYSGTGGLTAWAELAPAVVSYTTGGDARSLRAGIYASVGVGYRPR